MDTEIDKVLTYRERLTPLAEIRSRDNLKKKICTFIRLMATKLGRIMALRRKFST